MGQKEMGKIDNGPRLKHTTAAKIVIKSGDCVVCQLLSINTTFLYVLANLLILDDFEDKYLFVNSPFA
jgi:hypothetical protein